MFYKIASKKPV